MSDKFEDYGSGLESPASHLTPITPDDAADLAVATRAINVAQSGLVRMTTIGGTTADIFVAAGGAFPVRARRVWATGTTATGIVGLS